MTFRQEDDVVNEAFRQQWGADLNDKEDYPIWCYFLTQYTKRFDECNYTSLLNEIENRFHVVKESNIRLHSDEKNKTKKKLSEEDHQKLQTELKIWNVMNLRKIVNQYFIDNMQAFEKQNICVFTRLIEIKNKFLYPLIQHAINPAWQLSTRGVNVGCLCIHEQSIRDLFGYKDTKENGGIESQDSGALLMDLQKLIKEKERIEKSVIIRQGLAQPSSCAYHLPVKVVDKVFAHLLFKSPLNIKLPERYSLEESREECQKKTELLLDKKIELKKKGTWLSEEAKINLKTAAFIAGGILFGVGMVLGFVFGGGLPIIMGFLAIHLIHVAPLAVKLFLVVSGMLAGGGLGYGGKKVTEVVETKGKEEVTESCVVKESVVQKASETASVTQQAGAQVRFNDHPGAANFGVFGPQLSCQRKLASMPEKEIPHHLAKI